VMRAALSARHASCWMQFFTTGFEFSNSPAIAVDPFPLGEEWS